jgi:hypothetical protein
VSSLFRRKSAEVTEPEVVEPEVDEAPEEAPRTKGYTPSKRDRGVATPKRRDPHVRRAEPPVANRREAAKRLRDKQREERTEARRLMMEGDERYLLPRDKGEERALARDLVDSRRTIGTWFFGVTFLVFLGANPSMPPIVQLVSNGLFAVFAVGTILDGFLIGRTLKKLIQQRIPKSTVRMRGLYFYAFMRSITFRRMRVPKPRVKIGEAI